jgi:hydroxypyruvate reductase
MFAQIMETFMDNAALRAEATRIFQAGVDAADPAGAVRRAFLAEPMNGRPVVIALGKAAGAMMEEALRHVDAAKALVVTNAENYREIAGAEVMVGEHPVPQDGSVAAGVALLDFVAGLSKEDQVLALISGGGSALAIAPVDGVSAADKQAANAVLLASGLDIYQMNLVRQCLSRLKGGGLFDAASPARVRTLILSDVIGDDLRVVASGPTVGPNGTNAQAIDVLKKADIWKDMPASVREVLRKGVPTHAGYVSQNQVVGSNRVSLDAMVAACEGAVIVDDALEGDVAEAAEKVLEVMRSADEDCTLVFGGETTVKLKGDGIGGRNQELALRVALGAQDLPGDWVFLSGGTDGRDGPTDAAGGLVDAGTVARMGAAGLNVQAILENNDSYHGLKASHDLLVIGGTGTNVADVQVFLRRS